MKRMNEDEFQELAEEIAQALRPTVLSFIPEEYDPLLPDRVAACVGAMTGLQLEILWTIKKPEMSVLDALTVMNQHFGAQAEELLRAHFAKADNDEDGQ